MKRVHLSLLLLLFGSGLMAQSLIIEKFDSLIVGNAARDSDIYGYSTVKNISSDSILVRFKRIDQAYTALTDSNAICWGICFTTNISVSPAQFSKWVQPGDTATATTHVYPDGDGFAGSGPITYVFFDSNNPNDTATYTANYRLNGNPVSLTERFEQTLEVYPNPATDYLKVNFNHNETWKASFELLNLLGVTVRGSDFFTGENNLQINLQGLAKGVYFYRLILDGNAVLSKKLVIK
jgi:hypothetical protein